MGTFFHNGLMDQKIYSTNLLMRHKSCKNIYIVFPTGNEKMKKYNFNAKNVYILPYGVFSTTNQYAIKQPKSFALAIEQ